MLRWLAALMVGRSNELFELDLIIKKAFIELDLIIKKAFIKGVCCLTTAIALY